MMSRYDTARRHRAIDAVGEPSWPRLHLALAGLLIPRRLLAAAASPSGDAPARRPTADAGRRIRAAAALPAPATRRPPASASPRRRRVPSSWRRSSRGATRWREDAAGDVVRAAFREGQAHGLDPMLILAVIAVESRFNPFAASEQGALGLMQVVPRFHMDKIAALGRAGDAAPEANIALGTRILKDAIRRGGSDIAAGLQLYNGAVDDETQRLRQPRADGAQADRAGAATAARVSVRRRRQASPAATSAGRQRSCAIRVESRAPCGCSSFAQSRGPSVPRLSTNTTRPA